MPLREGFAPYAPLGSVLTVLGRVREKAAPEIIRVPELVKMGVAKGNGARTLQALTFLGLVDGEGRPTASLHALARVTSNELPGVLTDVITSAYPEVFAAVNPAEATDLALIDAFRGYRPQAQRARMIALFLGLCRAALVVPPMSAQPSGAESGRAKGLRFAGGSRAEQRRSLLGTPAPSEKGTSGLADTTNPLLRALLRDLPVGGSWTKTDRDRWLSALGAVVDYLVEVRNPAQTG